MRHAVLVIVVILFFAAVAGAQPPADSFEALKRVARPGETVYVYDATGAETKARIFDVSAITLALVVNGARRDVLEADVVQVERRPRDSVRNGVLIGAGAGALAGFLQGRRFDSPSCPRSGIECGQGAILGTTVGAFWGSVAGWLIDIGHRKREVIYAAPPRR